jgi:hypothetical protein
MQKVGVINDHIRRCFGATDRGAQPRAAEDMEHLLSRAGATGGKAVDTPGRGVL